MFFLILYLTESFLNEDEGVIRFSFYAQLWECKELCMTFLRVTSNTYKVSWCQSTTAVRIRIYLFRVVYIVQKDF